MAVVFGLCGDHTNPLFESCDAEGIRIIDARDERGAAWMAAGYALATGSTGVVLVSNTPALTNAATALADANANGTPVVCVTGGVGLADRGRGHPGDADQVAIAAPISKWAARAASAAECGVQCAQAMWQARSGRPGTAVLELPLDVQSDRAEAEPGTPLAIQRRPPDDDALARVRGAIASASRPVIIAGSGCFWSDAGDAVRTLAEHACIPVFTARAARGLVSDDHDLCFGFPNLLTETAQAVFGEADVALVAGCELDVLLGGGSFHPGCTLIRIDADPMAFVLGRKAAIEVHADPRSTLMSLAEGLGSLPTDAWIARLVEADRRRREELEARERIAQAPLHPGRLVAEIASKLPPEAIVCVDAGELALWAIDALPARAPGSLHLSSTSRLGALGMGVPQAIGAKVAHPDRPVLALCGDGSFGFTAMEVETSARHDAPIAVVIGNDGDRKSVV